MAKRKTKPAKKQTATLPAWECPKCGACHPITVTACCAPQRFQPGIIRFDEWPKIPPQRWTWPPDIICTVHPSAGPDYQNSGFREVKP